MAIVDLKDVETYESAIENVAESGLAKEDFLKPFLVELEVVKKRYISKFMKFKSNYEK